MKIFCHEDLFMSTLVMTLHRGRGEAFAQSEEEEEPEDEETEEKEGPISKSIDECRLCVSRWIASKQNPRWESESAWCI